MYGDDRNIIKGAQKASDSSLLKDVLIQLRPQRSVIAHIRFATVGSIKEENCHPFTGADISGRKWTMVHNGTIYSGKNSYRYLHVQKGDTDSERLFLAFMDMMNEKLSRGDICERERFSAVNDFVTEHAPRNKLNLIFYDGELLYAHKNMKNTLCYKKTQYGIIISTVPLDSGEWIPFPMTQLIAFRDGKEVYKGQRHKGIFVPTLDYITALDAMNI